MSKYFSSANKDISISGGNPAGKLDPKALLGSMTKDVGKRWMIVGAVSAISIALMAAWMSGDKAPRLAAAKPQGAIETSPKGLSSQKDWKAQTGAEILTLQKELTESRQAQREMLSRMEALRVDIGAVRDTARSTPGAGVGGSKLNLNIPAPPEPPKTLLQPGGQATGAPMNAPNTLPPGFSPVTPVIQGTPGVAELAPVKRSAARAFIPVTAVVTGSADEAMATDDMILNERKGFLPGGSFAAATLISGVEAFTGGTAQAQPQPMVVRLDANAILPNSANYQIKGCHVLASVWGDMSSERVFGRLATLTCVDTANRLVLSEEVEGVLVDSDGKNGIRGSLQDRQGAKLARSLLAGFAQGLSSAFGAAQSTVSSTALGTTSMIAGSDMAKAAGYNGASTATKQLADFYLKQAEATMPVIAVDAGRKVSVMFTKSKALRFETTDTYRIKPKEKLLVERSN